MLYVVVQLHGGLRYGAETSLLTSLSNVESGLPSQTQQMRMETIWENPEVL